MTTSVEKRAARQAPVSRDDGDDRLIGTDDLGAMLGLTYKRVWQLECQALRAIWRVQVSPEYRAARAKTVARLRKALVLLVALLGTTGCLPATDSVQLGQTAAETPTPIIGHYGIPNVTITARGLVRGTPTTITTVTDANGDYRLDLLIE